MKELANHKDLSCFVVGNTKENNNGLPMAVIRVDQNAQKKATNAISDFGPQFGLRGLNVFKYI